jgi:hypothetical protein
MTVVEFLLFVGYLILFSWLVTRIKFFANSGITKTQLIFFFLLKVAAGIFYGWIGIYYGEYAKMADTWNYHTESINEYHLLFSNPGEYFTNIFRNPYQDGLSKLFDSNNSYWNDLKSNVIIKILSVFNIFSFGSYFVNVIFFTFITFYGPVSFFKVMHHIFPQRRAEALFATFLVPSFLYWTSGIHKDGLIFLGISLIVYNVYFSFRNGGFKLKRIFYILFGLALLFPLRNYIVIILVPAMIAWALANRKPASALAIFAGVYLFFGLLFFTSRYIHPTLDFPLAVINKQQEFLKLEGHSNMPIANLEPTTMSFLSNMPQAMNHAILRPYPSDARTILALAAAIEVISFYVLFGLFLLFRDKAQRGDSFLLFCLVFSFSLLLIIGYTVHFLGAVVRYRSVVLPMLIVPMVCMIDWKRIGRLMSYGDSKNKNNI